MYKLLVILGGLILVSSISGCIYMQPEEPSSTTAPTANQTSDSAMTESTINDNGNSISQDILLLHDIAVKHFIELRLIEHEGSKLIVSLWADEHQNLKDYITALNETDRFISDIVLPPGSPEIKGGLITIEPRYQTNISRVLEKADQSPLTTQSEVIDALVDIAEDNGIVVDPSNSKLLIPVPALDIKKVGLITYKIIIFENIVVQGKFENIISFISTIESDTTPEPIILKSVAIAEVTEDDGTIETRAAIGLDFYTRP